jgi:micrococcal nuclease
MYEYKAKVLRVIDGDTLEMLIDLGFHTHRVENVRILDYDAPEVKLYSGVTQEEKELGLQAKAYAAEFFAQYPNVTINTQYDKTGKYGRFLGRITVCNEKNECIDYATMMINEGYVKS